MNFAMDPSKDVSEILVMDSELEGVDKSVPLDKLHTIEESLSEDSKEPENEKADITVIKRNLDNMADKDDTVTPSQHMPSLHFSGVPVLVSETLDESQGDQDTCLLAECGDIPHIIPSSPTLTDMEAGDIQECIQPDTEQRQSQISGCGPAVTGDKVHWQESQSLNLHLTSTYGSQQDTYQQTGTSDWRSLLENQYKDQNSQKQSQELHLHLSETQSSTSNLPEIKDESCLPISKDQFPQQQSAPVLFANDCQPGHVSQEECGEAFEKQHVSVRTPMSVSMIHSESQNSSETTIKLERPIRACALKATDLSQTRPKGNKDTNIFHRTRLGRRRQQESSEESTDDSSNNTKIRCPELAKNELSSDSEPIPCSQNCNTRSHSLIRRRCDSLETKIQKERNQENMFGLETVIDSEPEGGEDFTQTYDIFPALSKANISSGDNKSTQEEEEVPVLIKGSNSLSKQSQVDVGLGKQHINQLQENCQQAATAVSQRKCQLDSDEPENKDLFPSQEGPKTKQTSQDSLCISDSQNIFGSGGSQSSQLVKKDTNKSSTAEERTNQRIMVQHLNEQDKKEETIDSIQGKAVTIESTQKKKLNIQVTEANSAMILHSETSCEPSSPLRRIGKVCVSQEKDPMLLHDPEPSNPDPYSFADSQSQRRQTIALSKRRSVTGYKPKRLVKKKNEPVSKTEPESKSSSSDENSKSRPALPLSRRGRKSVYTKLLNIQSKKEEFKKPKAPSNVISCLTGSTEGPIHPQTASASNSEVSHLSPITIQNMEKQVTCDAVPSRDIIASNIAEKKEPKGFVVAPYAELPHQQYSLDHCLSDSSSLDTFIEETKIKEVVTRVVHRTISVQITNLRNGLIVKEKTSEEKDDPVIIEENFIIKKRRIMSPSNTGSTLTSGELADISSSSLSQKISSGHASLEHMSLSPELPLPVSHSLGANVGLPTTKLSPFEQRDTGLTSIKHSTFLGASTVSTPELHILSPNQSAIERDESRLEAVVTSSSSSGKGSVLLYSSDNMPPAEIPCAQVPSSSTISSSISCIPPTSQSQAILTQQTSVHTMNSLTKRMPADSSQEVCHQSSSKCSSAESKNFKPISESGGFSVQQCSTHKTTDGNSGSSDRAFWQETLFSTTKTNSGESGSVPSSEQMSLQIEVQKMASEPVIVQIASKLDNGARLMARWKDGFFYPATFIGLNTGIGNKFKVRFEDGLEKTVRAVDMIMAQHLPKGLSVLVTVDDGMCDSGIILDHILEGEEVFYLVSIDGGTNKRCTREQLSLTEDQASILLSDEDLRVSFGEKDIYLVNTADVSLDNILTGKRTRGSTNVLEYRLTKPSTGTSSSDRNDDFVNKNRTVTQKEKHEKAQVGSTPTSAKKTAKAIDIDDSTTKTSGHKRKIGPVATSTPTPKQRRPSFQQESPKLTNKKNICITDIIQSPQTTKCQAKKSLVGLVELGKGPIPDRGLFSGLVFLLTHVNKLPSTLAIEKIQLQDSSEASTEESIDDGALVENAPYDEGHLQAQIEAGDGTVLEEFNPKWADTWKKKIYLISDTYQRTIKYFQCLAAGIPLVSHTWIRDSCKKNRLLDYKAYVLPAGISLEKHALLERSPQITCLVGQRVLLTSSDPNFLEMWTSILEIARCKIITKFPSQVGKSRPGVDVVLTDQNCVSSIITKAKNLDIPVVSTEWIIQCLINNKLMNHRGHPRYAHDFWRQVKFFNASE